MIALCKVDGKDKICVGDTLKLSKNGSVRSYKRKTKQTYKVGRAAEDSKNGYVLAVLY